VNVTVSSWALPGDYGQAHPVARERPGGMAGGWLAAGDVDWQAVWSQDGCMGAIPRRVPAGSVGPAVPGVPDVRRPGRRRRPTGKPPPLPRGIHRTGLWWVAAAVVLVTLAKVVFGPAWRSLGVAVTVWDDAVVGWLARLHLPGLTGLMEAIVASTGSAAVVGVVRWGVLVALLVLRRIRHLVVFVGSFLAVLLAVRLATVDRPRPFGVELRGSWAGWAMPSRPVAIFAATLVGVLYTLVPVGRWRQLGKWVAAGLVIAFALARVGLGVDAPTDALVGAVIGVAVSVAAYRLFVPSEVFPVTYRRGRSAHLDVGGRRGEAIRDALADQLGLTVVEVKPFGLSGSAGSTPLRIQVQDGAGDTRYVFGKLYARSHLRADRSYKFARALRYGRLEDEKPFSTVRRLVQQEDYALSLMQRAGLPSPEPYGVAELTPEREYLIVFEFLDGATELGEADVDDAIIDQGLAIVRKLWDANLAHRDIKPANLLVRDGKLYLIDVFFAQLHPSPWRQAVDLANMLLCLALRSSPQQVYQRALRRFSVGEITEAFAAARGLALPSQLRRMMRDQGRDLHGEFVRLLPTPPRPIGVQRWSARRVGLLLLVLVALIPAVPMAWAFASSSANPDAGAAVSGGSGSCTQLEELWLQAQAVPSASRIPCFQAFPAGIHGALAVRNGESVLQFDRAGVDIKLNIADGPHVTAEAGSVTIRLTATCAAHTTTAGQTIAPGVTRFNLEGPPGTSEVADVFRGGCVTYRAEAGSASARLLDQAQRAVSFRTRDDLSQALRRRSGGRLDLYPAAP
jgi:tRNA A-37 threonylcarbamoyl transferase component Bud32/membrane-associated phospholipid phosphatase